MSVDTQSIQVVGDVQFTIPVVVVVVIVESVESTINDEGDDGDDDVKFD